MKGSDNNHEQKAPFRGSRVLEVAILNVIPNLTAEFEVAFAKAQQIIASMEGYVSHQLQ